VGAARRQSKHFRTECGKNPRFGGYGSGRGIQPVQKGRRGRERFAVPTGLLGVDQRRVADPDTQQEPVAVLGGQRPIGFGDIAGRVHPEVEDPRGDHGPLGGAQQVTHRVEHRPAHIWNPRRRKAQLVQFRCRVSGFGWVAKAQLTAPHSDTGKVHRRSSFRRTPCCQTSAPL
jgi:hypothetical protein